MWTPATRRQHNREGLRYETDLTDREWELIAPMMPAAAPTGRPPKWPLLWLNMQVNRDLWLTRKRLAAELEAIETAAEVEPTDG